MHEPMSAMTPQEIVSELDRHIVGQHLAMVQLAHLAGRPLDDDIAKGDLAVAANGDLNALRRVATHADDGRTVKLLHSV